jgi:hypothetical protein
VIHIRYRYATSSTQQGQYFFGNGFSCFNEGDPYITLGTKSGYFIKKAIIIPFKDLPSVLNIPYTRYRLDKGCVPRKDAFKEERSDRGEGYSEGVIRKGGGCFDKIEKRNR